MRITGGQACGRPIAVPTIHAVRPTGSKMRQSLFNILGNRVREAEFLDLFAGSGLIGFEALSRGAKRVTFIEKNLVCMRCIEINAQKLGYKNKIQIIRDDFRKGINSIGGSHFDMIFADPPYKSEFAELVLKLVDENQLLSDQGILVIEHQKNLELYLPSERLVLVECRQYSLSAFSFFTKA